MAHNLLLMKPVLRGSGTISEISSTSGKGSGFGSDTREELQDLVTILGLNSVNDLYQERFCVDRKKLEQMMTGGNENSSSIAERFFHKIMEETKTHIAWPRMLKIGAKSKKDPHVRIAGRPEDVAIAKEKILSQLEVKNTRVIMKIDVSYTDHSHIIGKGGKSIKQVMDETQCHIHFPDSNRTNTDEKSNQVSIAGDIRGVERARAGVRALAPLIFSFEMPIMTCKQSIPDVNSPYILHIQKQYNVSVMLRNQPKFHATLVIVKGSELEVNRVKEATLLLIQHICDSVADQILVQMSMEISPVHHPIVRGRESIHIKTIMKNTGTRIMFPEVSDPNIALIKKSNVTITGGIHSVYLARQQLMGSLPVMLRFDLPENCADVKPERLTQLMSSLDVFINISQKPKQNTLSVIVKGIERNASNIYEARHRLLNLNESRIVAQIPSTYFMADTPMTFMADYTANNPSQLVMQSRNSSWGISSSNHMLPFPNIISNNNYSQSYVSLNSLLTNSNSPTNQYTQNNNDSLYSNSMMSSNYENAGSTSATHKDSGFVSSNTSCRHSIDPIHSPNLNRSPSPLQDTSVGSVISSVLSNFSREPLIKPAVHDMSYDQRRLAAWHAIQSPISGYRIPNSTWSGYGFSATSPGAFCKVENSENVSSNNTEDDVWLPATSNSIGLTQQNDVDIASPSNINMDTSNLLEQMHLPSLQKLTSGNWQDLGSLLTMFGLEKYIKIFKDHEIDLETFQTLNDNDLIEIGISAFGARRKMHILISELKKRANPFCGSIAPGAERKCSSAGSSNSPGSGW